MFQLKVAHIVFNSETAIFTFKRSFETKKSLTCPTTSPRIKSYFDLNMIKQTKGLKKAFPLVSFFLLKLLKGDNLAPTINSLFMRYGSGKALIERLGRIKSRLPNISSISFGECGLAKLKDFDKEGVFEHF